MTPSQNSSPTQVLMSNENEWLAPLNRYLNIMHEHGAQSLVFETQKPISTLVNNHVLRIDDVPLSYNAVERLVRASADKDTVRRLLDKGEANYKYKHPNGSYYLVSAMKRPAWLRISFRPFMEEVRRAEDSASDVSTESASHDDDDGIELTVEGLQGEKSLMEALLRQMVKHGASDMHLSSGNPSRFRVDGDMRTAAGAGDFPPERLQALLFSITPDMNRAEFKESGDTDFAYEIPEVSRFRCNLFMDRNGIGGVFRQIPSRVLSASELHLSREMVDLCNLSKGLVIVTGPTGSGKSTTLAALVDHINATRRDHIITIEDPVEFVHSNKKCLVNQREVRVHTNSFKSALRAALREDPDIVLVGEMRDLETVAIAIETAETGHLVFGTLHTNTAPSTVDRVIDQFPADRQAQIRVMLSESLRAVIAQTLCKKKGGGRVAAHEVLFNIPSVANLIREGKTFQIPSVMQTSKDIGMVTLNQSLTRLVKENMVEPREAYMKAVDRSGLLILFKSQKIDFDPREQAP